jgi:hypothetical protein
MRTREELSALIEGRLASPAGCSALVELATRLIVEEALEGEARDTLADGVVAEYQAEPPNAAACFLHDFAACIAHLRLPIGHCRARAPRTSFERLFVEERRRLKIIPNTLCEKAECHDSDRKSSHANYKIVPFN